MSFRIQGLSPAPFAPLYGVSDEALAARGVIRYVADKAPGFPDRTTMCRGASLEMNATCAAPSGPMTTVGRSPSPMETSS